MWECARRAALPKARRDCKIVVMTLKNNQLLQRHSLAREERRNGKHGLPDMRRSGDTISQAGHSSG